MHAALWNGAVVSGLPVTSRGLAYGDGLFETLAVRGGRPRLLELHLERLQHGCARLGLTLDAAALADEIDAVLPSSSAHGVLKIIVMRRSGGRGYVASTTRSDRLLQWFPGSDPRFVQREAVAVHLCRQRLALQPALAGLKHLNRLEQVLARGERVDAAFAEGLLLDDRGCLIEAVASNLFLIQGDRLLTPRLDRCGVAGVMRRFVMERLAPACGLAVAEERLPLAALYGADELFLTNSLMGILPVAQVDCFALPGRSASSRLQQCLIEWQEQRRV